MKTPLLTDLIEAWGEWRKATRNRNRSGWDVQSTELLPRFIESMKKTVKRRKLP